MSEGKISTKDFVIILSMKIPCTYRKTHIILMIWGVCENEVSNKNWDIYGYKKIFLDIKKYWIKKIFLDIRIFLGIKKYFWLKNNNKKHSLIQKNPGQKNIHGYKNPLNRKKILKRRKFIGSPKIILSSTTTLLNSQIHEIHNCTYSNIPNRFFLQRIIF